MNRHLERYCVGLIIGLTLQACSPSSSIKGAESHLSYLHESTNPTVTEHTIDVHIKPPPPPPAWEIVITPPPEKPCPPAPAPPLSSSPSQPPSSPATPAATASPSSPPN